MSTLEDDLTSVAQEQLKRVLASYYARALGKGVDVVVNGLAQTGGYLDNPLVRILLPPPLMLAVDIARELNADPQAGVLDVLINSAAEQAIPGAAPILRAAIAAITAGDARALLDAGGTAGTEYLKAKTATALQEALRPLVASALAANGARQLYTRFLEVVGAPTLPTETVPLEPMPGMATDERPREWLPDLDDVEKYVTEQAIEGLFKELAAEEARIREELDGYLGSE